jgi:Family of unknown function (DUF6499)
MPYECDWRGADACAYLHNFATAFAWEFLRRNCAYQAIAGAGHAVAEMSERGASMEVAISRPTPAWAPIVLVPCGCRTLIRPRWLSGQPRMSLLGPLDQRSDAATFAIM